MYFSHQKLFKKRKNYFVQWIWTVIPPPSCASLYTFAFCIATRCKDLARTSRSHYHRHRHRPVMEQNKPRLKWTEKGRGLNALKRKRSPFSSLLKIFFLYGSMNRELELARSCISSRTVSHESRERLCGNRGGLQAPTNREQNCKVLTDVFDEKKIGVVSVLFTGH